MDGLSICLGIVHYGSAALLRRFATSLQGHPDFSLLDQVLIIDNDGNSEPDVVDVVAQIEGLVPVSVVPNSMGGYAAAANRAATECNADVLIIANNDLEWLPNWPFKPLFNLLMEEGVGVVGPQLINADGSWQRSYGPFPSAGSALRSMLMVDTAQHAVNAWLFRKRHPAEPKMVDYVDGAFMCIRRRCFDSIGGFDEDFSFYGEDADFCYRASRAGWRILFDPRVRVMHLRGASSAHVDRHHYTKIWLMAGVQFVKKHRGGRQAKLFERLIRAAVRLRTLVYGSLVIVCPSQEMRKRARSARLRSGAL